MNYTFSDFFVCSREVNGAISFQLFKNHYKLNRTRWNQFILVLISYLTSSDSALSKVPRSPGMWLIARSLEISLLRDAILRMSTRIPDVISTMLGVWWGYKQKTKIFLKRKRKKRKKNTLTLYSTCILISILPTVVILIISVLSKYATF